MTASKPLLLFFYSSTDGLSRRVEGYIAQVLQRRKNHQTFELRRIDARERPDLAKRFGVEALPTLVVVSENRVQARLERPRGANQISEALAHWLQ